eukprot:18522-Pelagococcus_subviridis.AAC.19
MNKYRSHASLDARCTQASRPRRDRHRRNALEKKSFHRNRFLVSFVDEPRHIYGRSHSRARLRHLHAAERDRLRRVRARIVRVVYR